MTQEDVKRNPINFLYCFSNPTFEGYVAKYISKKAANTIAQKRVNQIIYLDRAYDGTKNRQQAFDEVEKAIIEIYGITPKQILNKLLAGETVAGKNWRKGIFGIGQIPKSTYKDNSELKVDKKTGKIYTKDGQELKGTSAAIYGNKDNVTQITGYYYATEEGVAYTTKQSEDGSFYAYTYGTSEGMYAASGASVDAADFESVWEGIATCLPMIEKVLAWIASLAKLVEESFNAPKAKDTLPTQGEFMTSNDDTSLSSVAILGAVALGGFLLMGAPKISKK